VDDEPAQRRLLQSILRKQFEVVPAADGLEARSLLEARGFDLIITDDRMPRMSGTELVAWVRENLPETPVIVLTAYGSIETAVEAMRLGASDYLTKPLKGPDELRLVVDRALSRRRLEDRTLVHQADTDAEFPGDIVAHSQAMREVLRLAQRVAPQPATVLLTGASGTGKEVVARFIHRRSARSEAAFVAVNCAALTETLLDSELFGHEKGAFTGATQSRRGRFELAHQGTLFLDEITEMGTNLQAKLLRVLEEQQFERVGGTRTITVDVRVLAATNREPQEAIADGRLREDLYYRLSAFPIFIPPLKTRRDDIVPLAQHMLQRVASRMGQQPKGLSSAAAAALERHDWPGNVRELRNAVERALIVSQSDSIELDDLPLPRGEAVSETADATSLREVEKRAILEALEANDGDRRRTADQLGISLRTLQSRLKDYGLTRPGRS
jgi:two-component system response regulator FlrC